VSSDRWSDRAEELRVLIEDIADARAKLDALRMVDRWRETAEILRLEEDICRLSDNICRNVTSRSR